MDGKTHSRWFFRSLAFFVPYLIYRGMWGFIPLLFLSNSIVDSDEDQKWDGGGHHRYFLTHSILWPLLITFALWLPIREIEDVNFFRYLFILSTPIAIHLFLDLFTPAKVATAEDKKKVKWTWAKNPKTKYRIQLKKGKRLSATGTRIWLVANISLCLVLYFVGLFFYS